MFQCYHMFHHHNDEDLYNWVDFYYSYQGGALTRPFFDAFESMHGGITIYFDIEKKVAAVSICSLKDRFSRKAGRVAAQNRIHRVLPNLDKVTSLAPDPDSWLVLVPSRPMNYKLRMLHNYAMHKAIDIITTEYLQDHDRGALICTIYE